MSEKPRSHRTKLEDVARLAETSLTTASLVLGNKSSKYRISEEVLLRVRAAALELNYTPNRLVHSLQRGSTHILSFFSGFRNRNSNDLYMDTLTSAIERTAGQHGYDILVNCDFNRSPEETFQHLNGGIVDGVLFWAPQPDDPLLPFFRASHLPTVLVSAQDPEGVLPGVRDDVESGMRQLTERLVALGHRHIAVLVEEEQNNSDAWERTALLRRYLGEHRIALPDSQVLLFEGDKRAQLEQLMSAPEPPTALFCWRDRVAYWVLELCESLGIDVPGALSVVGYDGLPWPAKTSHTPVSVQVNMEALADAAIQRLLDCMGGQSYRAETLRFPVSLTTGTTLAPAPDFLLLEGDSA